jgi:hypothetical protein
MIRTTHNALTTVSGRLFSIGLMVLFLATSERIVTAAAGKKNATAFGLAMPEAASLTNRIGRGQAFLVSLFDPELELLPEFKGSRTCWLFHDNYLAAHILAGTRPDLARRIRSTLVRFGVTNSGKIEIVLDEAPDPLPFRTYQLSEVAVVSGRTIRTERVTTNLLQGWEQYADLLLLAAIAEARSEPVRARRRFALADAMWDGIGFKDHVVEVQHYYATYKLALYLIAAERLHLEAPHGPDALTRLLALQEPDGGWRTDFSAEAPLGLANVETTCLSLLALEAVGRARPRP